jgi:hypothetical protein
MRSPPPVSLDIGHDPVWLVFQGLALGLSVSVIVVWVAALVEIGPPWAGAAAASGLLPAGLTMLLGRLRARRLGPLRLVFDGQVWTCARPERSPARERCTPVVVLDLGSWMLLRIDPADGSDAPERASRPARRARRCWVSLSRRSAAAHWHALRVALYCADTGQSGRPAQGRPEG